MMIKKGYSISGMGLERLLETLKKQQIPLYDVKRTAARTLQLYTAIQQSAQVEETAAQLGFVIKALPARGAAQRLEALKRQKLLPIFALIMLFLLLGALRFVWHVEISGAGIYLGEVRSFLAEQRIVPGIPKSAVNIQALCDALLYRLPRVTWVRAEIRGLTLHVDITQGTPAPTLESNDGNGSIVAARDGVIEEIRVYSGTAAVKPGDTVRAGDVLIQGWEHGSDDTPMPVRARGTVRARVWYSAQATAPAAEIISLPTGNIAQRQAISSPWFCCYREEAPAYLTSDHETARIPIGGVWLPVWRETTTYTEVALEKGARDLQAAQAEAGTLAMRRLLRLCGENDEMIDKWLDYSMIDGETILASATMEVITEAGRFLAESSQ